MDGEKMIKKQVKLVKNYQKLALEDEKWLNELNIAVDILVKLINLNLT